MTSASARAAAVWQMAYNEIFLDITSLLNSVALMHLYIAFVELDFTTQKLSDFASLRSVAVISPADIQVLVNRGLATTCQW
jgi:hypothetical protein